MKQHVTRLVVNSKTYMLTLKPQWTLSHVIRNVLELTGTKEACCEGACGACTVIVDGRAVPSCMMLAVEQGGKEIETIEGLSKEGELHPIQEAWLDEYGSQCGFCTAGMIMSAKALLDRKAQPTESDVKEALAGNICICSNYEHIIRAVMVSAKKIKRSDDSV